MEWNKKWIFLIFFTYANVAFASDWKMETNWPDSPAGASLDADATISELVEYFFEWGIILGVVITFGILVYASLRYVTSSGDSSKLSDAKSKISSAFLGLIILFGSWVLLSILNPELAAISNITVPSIEFEDKLEPLSLYQEKDLCDYGIVTYNIRGESEIWRTLINHGDIRIIQIEPHSSVSCKSQSGFGNDTIQKDGSDYVKFIKSRILRDTLYPECNLDDDDWQNTYEVENLGNENDYPEEILIELQGNIPKYCYKNIDGRNRTIKYISQKPEYPTTSCLAGDRTLIGGGGCALNLYETDLASRCGHMISSTSPMGNDVADSYDRRVNCIEIVRYATPMY